MSPLFIPGTNSAAGLNATTMMIQQQGRHDDGVSVVVIFLTDGRSNSAVQTETSAENLHTTLPEVTLSMCSKWRKHEQNISLHFVELYRSSA